MPSGRSAKNLRSVLLALFIVIACWLHAYAAAPITIPVVSRITGSATITSSSGTSHELRSVEPLQPDSTLTTALDSIISVHLEQVGQVQLGPQTKTSVSFRNGWLSFQMSSGSLCIDAQSQNVSVNVGSLRLAVSSPSTIYDVLQDGEATTIAVFRGGIVVGGPHTSTKNIYAGSAAKGLNSTTLSEVAIASVVSAFANLKCPEAEIISQVVPPSSPPVAPGGGHSGTILATLFGLAAIAVAAGHGGGGGSISTKGAPGPVQVTPASLSFGNIGSSNSMSFTVSESNYGGSFTIDSGACTGTASVSPTSGVAGQSFVVTPLAAGGPCNVKVLDDHGGSANVAVTVGPFGGVAPSPSSVSLRVGGPNGPISVSESGYTGVFTAGASGCSGIVTITPASGTSFSVSPAGVGNCRITFSDDHGQSAPSFAFVTAGNIFISPQTIQLTGTGDARSFTVSESTPTTFSAVSSDLGVATVTLVASTPNAATFNVTAVLNGKATISVTDTIGGAGNVSVGVGQSPLAAKRHALFASQPLQLLPSGRMLREDDVPARRTMRAAPATDARRVLVADTPRLVFAHIGISQMLSVTEKGYTGLIFATSSDPNVASVAYASGVGDVTTIVVISRRSGNALIRVIDDQGGQITVAVTVRPEASHAFPSFSRP